MPGSGLQTDARNEDMPDFMSAVMTIDNELPDEDVDSMKFLCQGLVGGKKLSKVETSHELVTLLQGGGHVTPHDFFLLADLLQYISRVDVLERIGFKQQEVMIRRHQQGSMIKPFYILLFQIAYDMDNEDVKKAAFFYGKVPRSRKVSSGLDLFTVMVEHQQIIPENVDLLVAMFRSLGREDVVELIRKYVDTNGESVMREIEKNFAQSLSLYGPPINPQQLFPQHSQVPPQPERQPPRRFQDGQGPSINDYNVKGSRSESGSIRPPTACSSDPDSMAAQASTIEPSAPPPSLPASLEQGRPPGSEAEESAVPQPQLPERQSVNLTSAAPEGYDNYDIPWNVLEILIDVIPVEFWPEISYQLGAPVTSDWQHLKTDLKYQKLLVLKRWLELPETKAKDTATTRGFLVETLHKSGPTLLAEEITTLLNVNYRDIKLSSSSTLGSGPICDTNDVASVTSAGYRMEQGSGVTEEITGATKHNEAQALSVRRPLKMQTTQDNPSEGASATAASGMALAVTSQSPIPRYRMNRIPRGCCVIINNRDFYVDPYRPNSAKRMVSREGTDIDRDKLRTTFAGLGFIVNCKDNCSDTDMIQIINEQSMQNHERFDCFVCCILSHGIHGQVYGNNGITVPIRDLTGPLRAQSCPTLAGKPKLFFLQACQGREKQEGYASDIERDSEMEEDGAARELIPNESDFLLGYATVPGFVSYRSKTRGSWYITKLTELLDKFAYDHDILDILTLVNFEVGRGDALIDQGTYKQSPAPMYSLRKKLFFVR